MWLTNIMHGLWKAAKLMPTRLTSARFLLPSLANETNPNRPKLHDAQRRQTRCASNANVKKITEQWQKASGPKKQLVGSNQTFWRHFWRFERFSQFEDTPFLFFFKLKQYFFDVDAMMLCHRRKTDFIFNTYNVHFKFASSAALRKTCPNRKYAIKRQTDAPSPSRIICDIVNSDALPMQPTKDKRQR